MCPWFLCLHRNGTQGHHVVRTVWRSNRIEGLEHYWVKLGSLRNPGSSIKDLQPEELIQSLISIDMYPTKFNTIFC